MTRKLLTLAFMLTVAVSGRGNAEWPDVDIELVTCSPDGVIASIKRAYDPKRFWVSQYVDLEMALEEEDLRYYYELCNIDYRDDQVERLECISWYKNRHASMVKCLRHSKKMCRLHGGFC